MVQDWKVLDEESRERLVDSLVGDGQYQKIKAQADAMVASAIKAAPPDRMVRPRSNPGRNCCAASASPGR